MKKGLSVLLCLLMLVQYIPTTAFAAGEDNLCEHHTEHTAECGYVEAAAGSDCAHSHDDTCGYKEAVAEVICACEATDESGALVHTEGCGYTAPVAGADCTHTHGDCGYVAPVEAKPCTFVTNGCPDCKAAAPTAQEVTTYTVTVGDCANGTVAADKTTAAQGENVTLSVTPAEGFVLDTLEVKQGETVLEVKGNTFLMPAGNVTITAVFKTAAKSAEPIDPVVENTCTCEAAEGEAHAEGCALYVAPADPVCSKLDGCTEETHVEGCALYVAPADPVCSKLDGCTEETHVEGCKLYVAPADPVCTCETDNGTHATFCGLYTAPENPECKCAIPCGSENLNLWCDVCGIQGEGACEADHDEGAVPYASGTCGEDLTWTYDESTYTLTISGDGAMDNYSSGKAPWYGNRTAIQRVVIESGVPTIGSYAFQNCSSLTSITIPVGVTSIGDAAFQNCSSLTNIDIPSNVTSIGDAAFFGCGSVTSIDIPDSVTTIGSKAFAACTGLTSITIPVGVTTIGDAAFQNCSSLTNIDIPAGVTTIGSSAFYNCTSLTSIDIPAGVTSIGDDAFARCTGLTSITIPNSVTQIGTWAFYSCTSLTSITIPAGVTTIDSHAFTQCTGLTSVIILNGVTTIGGSAFEMCTSLTSVTIPASVTTIDSHAFIGCTNQTTVNVPCSWDVRPLYTFAEGVEVKIADHTGAATYNPADNDAQHTATYDGCKHTVTEAHKLDCTVNEAGSTITGSCPCGKSGTVTLTPVSGLIYNGSEQTGATVTQSPEGVFDLTAVTVTYDDNINAGTHTASITYGGQTATCQFTIAQAEPDVMFSSMYPSYCGKPMKLFNAYVDNGTASFSLDKETWSDEVPTGIDAGTYTVYCKIAGSKPNYADIEITTYGTITKRNVTLTSASAEKEYDGTALTKDVVIPSENNEFISYSTGFVEGEGATYVVTGSQTNVGSSENTFTYTLNSNTKASNYNITCQFGTLTVKDRTQKYQIAVQAKSNTVTYDGTEKTLSGFETLTFIVNGNTYTVEGLFADEVKATNVGTYALAVTGTAVVKDAQGTDVTNQFTVTPQNGQLTITAAKPTYTAPTEKTDLTYNGTAQELITEGTVTTGSTMYYSLGDNGTFSISIPTATNAGEYTVWYYVEGDENHSDSEKASVIVTIAQKELIPTISGRISKTYDGTTDVPASHSLSITLDGKVGNDDVTASATYAYDSADAGTTKVNATNITLGGQAADNYTLRATTASAEVGTINKAAATVITAPEAISGLKFIEENGREVQQNLVTAGEAAGGTMVYRVDDGEWSETVPTAGQVRDYTVSYKVLGDSNHNDSAEGQVNVSIAKADAPTVTIPEQEHFYTIPTTGNRIDIKSLLPNLCAIITNQSSVTGTTGDFIKNAVLNDGILTYDTVAASTPATGTITVKIVMRNYEDVTVTVNVELIELNPVYNSGTDDKITYDGGTYDVSQMFTKDTNAGEASYAIIGGTGAGTLNGSELTITKAGTIQIKMTTAANGAYAEGEATATLTVKKADGAGSVTMDGWTYGDNAKAPTTENGTGTATFLYTGTDYSSAEAPTNAGTYTVTATFAENDLYEEATASDTFAIAKRELTPIVSGNVSKTYDGTTDVPASHSLSITLDGKVGSDDVSATATYAYDGADVGTTKIVATGIALSGEDAKNYTLKSTTANADVGTITKADPSYEVPTGLTATYGDTLAKVTLPRGFTWEAATTTPVGNVGTNTFKVTYTPDDIQNYNVMTGIDVRVEVAKAAVTITADSKVIYIGEDLPVLTCTVSGLLNGETLDTPPTLTTNADKTKAGSYTITAANADAGDNYAITYVNGTLTIMDKNTEVETKIEKTELTTVPDGLKNTPYNTVAAIKQELTSRIVAASTGFSGEDMAHYDVTLQFSLDGGNTWILATEENFPTEGITVTLPYPNGTNAAGYDFVVSHMFTVTSQRLGTTAGGVELPRVTETASGIRVTLNGLSPVTVAWKATEFDVDIAGTTNGTVTTNVSKATSGTEVTVTVTPKSGYKMATLTVKDASGKSYAVSTDNNGKYYFTMPAADVTVTATFSKISSSTADPTNPKTGDDFQLVLWSSILCGSVLGVAILLTDNKKRIH